MYSRYLEPYIFKDLQKKMVFLGGPRQCGKTSLAQSILRNTSSGKYFNWDRKKDRLNILQESWIDQDFLLIFDEIHKYKLWRNYLKGIFDTEREHHQFLVTGSARLDLYRRGGDSLLGRYFYWRLHPFTLSEIPEGFSVSETFSRLMRVGGFPEPFLDGNEQEARRWRVSRTERVLREDINDLESIKDIQTFQLLVELLQTRIGGAVVYTNLSEDLQVASSTVKKWIEILERMYLIFTVLPYTNKLPRAIQKPPKVYFYDNADVEGDEGARFENLVATHLIKKIQFLQDRDGDRYELRYIRDREKHEVDFVILKNREILQLIEVKWSDSAVSKSLQYFSERLKPKNVIQIVGTLKSSWSKNQLHMLTPYDALSSLSL
jgi:predicted AAA+ superfamily ATPase